MVIQRRIGSHMASRCQCCSATETIQHLFIDIPTADIVWRHFADIFHITLRPFEGFQYRFQTWRFSGMMQSTEIYLWSRGGSFGEFTTPFHICIHAVYFGTSIGVETWTSLRFLVSLLPPPSPPPHPPTLVFWHTPPVGSYKINTDGCVKDGFASGRVIIRDSSGQCIRAFFSFYGDCIILEAELRAILN
ncbi:Uncharacterized protein Adt_25747 [Abeliophyllum distichum]|uniref:RNase H type-1 domain-containing protein n=1 Tax=Abeliophyllum distichum TaxID=126358 RepID=A0ABD1SKM5_9LAMI